MTSDERAFLLAIAAEPSEDTPRLAYADWLDEQEPEVCSRCGGNGRISPDSAGVLVSVWLPQMFQDCPVCGGIGRERCNKVDRAEFIRVQIERENWSKYEPPAEILEIANSSRLYASSAAQLIADKVAESMERAVWLDRRSAELLERYRADWLHVPGTASAYPIGGDVIFARGFPFAVECRMRDVWADDDGLTQWAKAVVKWHPVEEFRIVDKEPHYDGVWHWFRMSLIESYEVMVSSGLDYPLIDVLSGSTEMPGRVSYSSREAACTALARGLAQLARQEVARDAARV